MRPKVRLNGKNMDGVNSIQNRIGNYEDVIQAIRECDSSAILSDEIFAMSKAFFLVRCFFFLRHNNIIKADTSSITRLW